MTSSPPPLKIYGSPKRKRGEAKSIEYSPQALAPRISGISTNAPKHLFPEELRQRAARFEDGVLSSRVTGQLRTLDLHGAFEPVGQITSPNDDDDDDAGRTKKRLAQSVVGEQPASPETTNRPPSHEGEGAPEQRGSAKDIVPSNMHPADEGSAVSSTTVIDRPRVQRRSPPLSGDPEDNPMTWHESEITGHNTTDPNDDGYGINGIGFKPTPAIAWARSRKRKQQLADYRNREAREARQRRSERRGGSAETMAGGNAERVKKRDVKVRFEDLDCG